MKADYAERREHMVATQLAARGIHAEAVLQAMRTVPREAFVEAGFEDFAYQDAAMPIAPGQILVKVRRLANGGFDQQALADVAFVPLVGAQGWADEDARA
ncbi:hypothetical protein ASC95_13550 [Pelomonas sp. Root1217]|uniref:hypothetical protein n=1 Tax=Pelomonas sp. Root1217 TaxID=1736430 RepID=UPI00070FBAA6|nr:hypothetical protein [Pelomonas sp. Root1217]KQV50398.1 hypothetical protein ASC95_13550 [Pelomonas sp. Root1217]